MKRCISFLLAIVALAGAASLVFPPLQLSAQTKATATNVPVIPHESVPNFFKNPPGIYTGENMGIATNSKGNIYIYHRANETRLFEYSPQGVFIREIGRNNYGFAFAHSVRVDAQDNIWAVDEGTDMIVKFNPEGRVLWVFGRRKESAEAETGAWEHVNPPLAPIEPEALTGPSGMAKASFKPVREPAGLRRLTPKEEGT